MKRTFLPFFFSIWLICPSMAQVDLRVMESLVMPSRILNQDVHFSVCLPEDYFAGNRRFPVVYLLHGLGDDETSWLEYGRISQYNKQVSDRREAERSPANCKPGTRRREAEPVNIIFVMPEGFRSYYVNDYKGSFRYQDMFVNELVPYIDSLFRTIPDRRHRALMGYSMGGFGALTLHLKYPDIFGTAVPLSISIRTDEQYMAEDGREWDQQWGRLFGAEGLTGPARITEYYRQNCPFHMLPSMKPDEIRKLNIYIDNGDEEQTLCRSNEELHILMHSLGIPHEFRVRDGGHSFGYWTSALPGALRFISDAFEGKPYRQKAIKTEFPIPNSEIQVGSMHFNGKPVNIYKPADYNQTSRLYPVIYFFGDLKNLEMQATAAIVNQGIESNTVCPMLLVFLPSEALSRLAAIVPQVEREVRVRKGYRFRAVAVCQAEIPNRLSADFNELQFSSCILSNTKLGQDGFQYFLDGIGSEALNRTQFFIDAPDHGGFVEGNGRAHMLLRDKDISHEYRVRAGSGDDSWFLGGWPEILNFISDRFHK